MTTPNELEAALEIVDVEAIILAAEREPDLPVWQRGWTQSIVVRVETACGEEGWGLAETQPEVARAIVNAEPHTSFDDETSASVLGGLRSILVGQTAASPEPLWRLATAGMNIYGRRGAALQALSAVDMACWDVLGRRLGVHVSYLLGGRQRDRVPSYLSAVLPDDEQTVREICAAATARGLHAVKFGWGAFRLDDHEVYALLQTARESLPAASKLILDVGYDRHRTTSETVRLVRGLVQFDPLWVEEPCHPEDRAGYRAVAARVDVPIAAGEGSSTLADFAALIEDGIEIIQPDVSRCGGFTVSRRVAALAEDARRRLVPHAWQNDLLIAASAALACTVQGETWVETSSAVGPLATICDPPLVLDDGDWLVPEGPGLGTRPDPAVVEALRVT